MSKRTQYSQGTPNWTDLSCKDIARAKDFYAAVLGWDFEHIPTDQGSDYIMAKKNGLNAAGMMQQQPNQTEMPAMWSVYLAVEDADAAAQAAQAAGAQVMMPAMDVMDSGRMAFIIDPTGAAVGLWQAKNHIGASIVNEPGAFTWAEVFSPDIPTAQDFYKTLGLEAYDMPMGEGANYNAFKSGEAVVGGAMVPPMKDIPAHWHAYFGVDDCDAAVETVKAKGGSVIGEPFDTPVGRIAVVQDPDGARFSLITMPTWN